MMTTLGFKEESDVEEPEEELLLQELNNGMEDVTPAINADLTEVSKN